MAISLGSNLAALRALRRLNYASGLGARSSEQLSSGLRINRASDDAAGLSVAARLHAQSRVYSQAVRNANDAISLLNVADSATSQLTGVLQRLRELATQAASGALSSTQRSTLDAEAGQLVNEYNRVINTTMFNRMHIIRANSAPVTAQVGYGLSGSIRSTVGDQLERTVGTGQFGSGTAAMKYTLIEAGDMDGDGREDFVGFDSGKIYFVKNTPGGYIQTSSATLANVISFDIGNLNNDQYLDIVAVTASDTVHTFYGSSNATFSAGPTHTLANLAATDLRLGDSDHDGDDDIFVTGIGSFGGLFLLKNNGSSLASFALDMSRRYSGLELGDPDNDGDVEIFAKHYLNTRLFAFKNSSSSTVDSFSGGSPINISGAADYARQIALGDFNGDGLMDLAVGTGSLDILYGNSSGGFSAAQNRGHAGSARNLHVADLNNDGIDDLISVNGNLYSFMNEGGGVFAERLISTGQGNPSGGALGDFNGDGIMDIVTSGASTHVMPGLTTGSSVLPEISIATQSTALEALVTIDEALARVSRERGATGAAMSRLHAALALVQSAADTTKAAAGRIVDADVASESAELVRTSILQNTAQAILASANQQPALAITLLETSGSNQANGARSSS